MKILMVNTSFTSGGAAFVAMSLVEGLKKQGHEIKFYSIAGLNDQLKKENTFQRILRNIHWKPFQRAGIADIYHPLVMPKELQEAFDWADIVHLHNIHGGFFNLKWLNKIYLTILILLFKY